MDILRVSLGLASLMASGCFYQPTGSEPLGTGDTGTSVASSTTSSSSGEPGETGDTDAPTTGGTSGPPGVCGDGIVDPGEACDDGDDDDTDACTNACTLATCGDGVIGPGETCDDGNIVDDDACANDCLHSSCGDGVVQPGEDCDTSGESAACNANCTSAACGDGVVNVSAKEQCDDRGESPICDADCSPAACGDGVHNPTAGEACDDGNSAAGDTCSSTCASTNIVDVAVGQLHVCVAFTSGAVRCWGRGLFGALGQGDEEARGNQPGELPVPDVPVGGKVVQLSSGAQFVCARLDTGAVRCWGYNSKGQLGDGGVDPLGDGPGELPTADVALDLPALQVAVGGEHSCAIVTGGKVRCWGNNYSGQLGYWMHAGASLSAPNGEDVPLLEEVSQLALGYHHTCARHKSGDVRCWGLNSSGQLGVGHTDNIGDAMDEMPPAVVQLDLPALDIAAGREHTCAVLMGGAVRCWGVGTYGKLGTGQSLDIGDQPGEIVKDVDLGEVATRVVAGNEHTCALLATEKVKCWGYGKFGAPGYGKTLSINIPEDFPPPDVPLEGDTTILASHLGDFTCAVLTTGTLRCWGSNAAGQLGQGNVEPIGDDETPAEVDAVPF